MGEMVEEPYNSSIASVVLTAMVDFQHREYTDSTLQKLDFMSSEKPETALAMAAEIFAKFGNGEEEFANPVLTGEIFADGDDDGEEFTCQVVRELVKISSMQTSSQ